MCLSDEAREEYWRLAEAMDDERLEGLDRYYREDVGKGGTTVDAELHFIVTSELANRREQRIRRLKRALWLSTRRGRLVEAVWQWLVRRGLWSSARARVVEAPPRPQFLAVRQLRFLLLLVCAPFRFLHQRPGRPCAAMPRRAPNS